MYGYGRQTGVRYLTHEQLFNERNNAQSRMLYLQSEVQKAEFNMQCNPMNTSYLRKYIRKCAREYNQLYRRVNRLNMEIMRRQGYRNY